MYYYEYYTLKKIHEIRNLKKMNIQKKFNSE